MKVQACEIVVTATIDVGDDPEGGVTLDGLAVEIKPEPGFVWLLQTLPTLGGWLRQAAERLEAGQ